MFDEENGFSDKNERSWENILWKLFLMNENFPVIG